jgi:hypothetical protein
VHDQPNTEAADQHCGPQARNGTHGGKRNQRSRLFRMIGHAPCLGALKYVADGLRVPLAATGGCDASGIQRGRNLP